ncbi:hypothetical protein LOTGIDRAFT_228796 [Lottia gigantea]|uniref:Uncharacterized protein n=1 Tax=Lottia gigantea TaxID=225164 RepID=V4ADF6_LOTGI|nr:hypothetical protein LOTGIDRAFT_228796 [Lottia gigantea]ESO91336.1 hypothetical protein LOTGIDRAFT_228796 [Lottia gigantea]
MASVCLQKFHDSKEINIFIERQHEKVEIVKGLLIDKHFEKCIDLCKTIINDGKEAIEFSPRNSSLPPQRTHRSSSPSSSEITSRLNEIIDTAVILSIQAIAELNKWTEVIPFVRKTYGEIENCPPKVMQICLLLHARVKEYIQCHALAKIWTSCESNHQLVGYRDVVNVYILQIIAPIKSSSHTIKMLNNFKGLSPKDKLELTQKLKECKNVRENERMRNKNSGSINDSNRPEAAHGDDDIDQSYPNPLEETSNNPFDTVIQYGSCKLRQWYSQLTKDKLFQIWKIILMTALAIFAFIQTQYGDFASNLNRAMVVWQGVLKIFKTMFGFDRPQ